MNSEAAAGSKIPEPLRGLGKIVGKEQPIEEISRELHFLTPRLGAAEIGAMHITCADEAELECQQAFQHSFVEHLVPKMKFGHRAAFRLSNLGGRYEWGAVPIAEDHFATPVTADSFKLLVIKLNTHVAVDWSGASQVVGRLTRYGRESTCCGALSALLEGGSAPFLDELRRSFGSEEKDRVATLLDASRVPPEYRSLFAAVVSARLQARKVILDIQDYKPQSPTFYLVLPSVTLNRERRDGEILCGLYSADHRRKKLRVNYVGLGDDPADYHLRKERAHYVVEDSQRTKPRAARDHRELVLQRWRKSAGTAKVRDQRMERIRAEVAAHKHIDRKRTRALLKSLLLLLGQVSPVSAAVLLFAQGVAGIHHAFRAHRLAAELAGSEEARQILDDINAKVDQLEPEQARALIELLVAEHSG